MDAELDALKTDVLTLKADYRHAEAKKANVDESIKELKSHVEQLQRDRSQLIGIVKVFAAFGLLGAAFVAFVIYLWTQLDSLKNELSAEKEQEAKLKSDMIANKNQFDNDVNKDKIDIRQVASEERKKAIAYLKDVIPKVIPQINQKVTFLEPASIVKLVEHYGDMSPTGPQDIRVKDMTVDGLTQDCKGIVPDNARGAILSILIGRNSAPPNDGSANFISTD
jgi:DNA repair exonuclease SbcCD ATPase subunit